MSLPVEYFFWGSVVLSILSQTANQNPKLPQIEISLVLVNCSSQGQLHLRSFWKMARLTPQPKPCDVIAKGLEEEVLQWVDWVMNGRPRVMVPVQKGSMLSLYSGDLEDIETWFDLEDWIWYLIAYFWHQMPRWLLCCCLRYHTGMWPILLFFSISLN